MQLSLAFITYAWGSILWEKLKRFRLAMRLESSDGMPTSKAKLNFLTFRNWKRDRYLSTMRTHWSPMWAVFCWMRVIKPAQLLYLRYETCRYCSWPTKKQYGYYGLVRHIKVWRHASTFPAMAALLQTARKSDRSIACFSSWYATVLKFFQAEISSSVS